MQELQDPILKRNVLGCFQAEATAGKSVVTEVACFWGFDAKISNNLRRR